MRYRRPAVSPIRTRRPDRIRSGGASEVDIDHVVALGDAWQKGAQQWPYARRVAFANDPLNLLAVDASANRQKGDGDAATWLPAEQVVPLHYVARQIAVKQQLPGVGHQRRARRDAAPLDPLSAHSAAQGRRGPRRSRAGAPEPTDAHRPTGGAAG